MIKVLEIDNLILKTYLADVSTGWMLEEDWSIQSKRRQDKFSRSSCLFQELLSSFYYRHCHTFNTSAVKISRSTVCSTVCSIYDCIELDLYRTCTLQTTHHNYVAELEREVPAPCLASVCGHKTASLAVNFNYVDLKSARCKKNVLQSTLYSKDMIAITSYGSLLGAQFCNILGR